MKRGKQCTPSYPYYGHRLSEHDVGGCASVMLAPLRDPCPCRPGTQRHRVCGVGADDLGLRGLYRHPPLEARPHV